MSQYTWPNSSLVVTGAGMVSSLGLDIITACAAARAGLVRVQPLDYFLTLSLDDFETVALSAHQVPFVTSGFEGPMRLVRLLQAAFEDLIGQTDKEHLSSTQTGFYLSLPDPLRLNSALGFVVDDEDSKSLRQLVAEPEELPWNDDTVRYLLKQAAKFAGWQSDVYVQSFKNSGHAGLIEAVRDAAIDLYEKKIRCAIVGAVDSLLEEESLYWLDYHGRLKAPENASGIQPGEAAALFVIEPEDQAMTRGAVVLARLHDASVSSELDSQSSAKQPSGQGLINIVVPLMETAESDNRKPPWFITDQNGEVYRTMEWGLAAARLTALFPSFEQATVWYPAASFGETGAASGALSLCLAIRAFLRDYAVGTKAIILSSSEGPERAGLIVGCP